MMASISTFVLDEGSRPIFMRPELTESARERSLPPEEYRRIVAINTSRATEREREREHSHDRQRYSSPGHYERSRGHYSREDRSRSPIYESRRPSSRNDYVDHREKLRDDRYDSRRGGTSRTDLRHELDVRRRDDDRHYPERRPLSYERESDLRSRIIEKRSEPHRREERDQRIYESDRDREKHSRSHHQSPPHERRRGSLDGRDSGKPSRDMWEKEHESDRRRRAYSRERDEERGRSGGNGSGRERYHHEEFHEAERSKRFPYKPEFEPKMKQFYRHEEKEFVPMGSRGRGGPPVRGRGMPPMPRGRGVIRGLIRGFRGGPIMRGAPGRGGFMGMRGFPPRKS